MTAVSRSQSQVVAVLVLHVLADPQDDGGDADEAVGDDVLDAHAHHGPRDLLDGELEDEDDDAARHAAGEGREAQEQHDAGLPGDARPRVAERVGREPRLLDRVDDEHAERAEDEGQPVDEGHMHVRHVQRRLRPHGGVDEDVEGERELRNADGQNIS